MLKQHSWSKLILGRRWRREQRQGVLIIVIIIMRWMNIWDYTYELSKLGLYRVRYFLVCLEQKLQWIFRHGDNVFSTSVWPLFLFCFVLSNSSENKPKVRKNYQNIRCSETTSLLSRDNSKIFWWNFIKYIIIVDFLYIYELCENDQL